MPVPSEGRVRAAGQVLEAVGPLPLWGFHDKLLKMSHCLFRVVTEVVVVDLCLCQVKLG